jgi:hypothetical protein
MNNNYHTIALGIQSSRNLKVLVSKYFAPKNGSPISVRRLGYLLFCLGLFLKEPKKRKFKITQLVTFLLFTILPVLVKAQTCSGNATIVSSQSGVTNSDY